MNSDIASKALRRGIDPVVDLLTADQAREIAGYHADEALQQRIEWPSGHWAPLAPSDAGPLMMLMILIRQRQPDIQIRKVTGGHGAWRWSVSLPTPRGFA